MYDYSTALYPGFASFRTDHSPQGWGKIQLQVSSMPRSLEAQEDTAKVMGELPFHRCFQTIYQSIYLSIKIGVAFLGKSVNLYRS